MGNEKWILYDNRKRRNAWVDPGQQTKFLGKPNVWEEVTYYEFLKSKKTVTPKRYQADLAKYVAHLRKKNYLLAKELKNEFAL